MPVTVLRRNREAVLKLGSLSNEKIRLVRNFPGTYRWEGSSVVFEPSGPNIDYVRNTFTDALWHAEALKFAQVVDAIRQSAIAPPPKQSRDYVYKTEPFEKQREVFELSRDKAAFALLMEQGTGKTKVTLDTAAWLYAQGKIRGLLIVAKNGVHRNWIDTEIPKHLPDYCNAELACWSAQKGEKKIAHIFKLDPNKPRLAVLAVNIEALSTSRGEKICERFMLAYPSLMVVDESTSIKTPKAKRTKATLRLGSYAPIRRILTGTPITKGPLDAYSQFGFLDDNILDCPSFFAFKARYAVLKALPGVIARGRPVEIVVGYQNLEDLKKKIAPYSFRVLKKDMLDIPEKMYQRETFQMTEEQWRLYEELEEELVTEFQGRRISAPLAMTKLQRFQQIACGFMPSEDPKNNPGVPIVEKNPRIEKLIEILGNIDDSSKVIIFATYRQCLRDIWAALEKEYGKGCAVAYSGSVKSQDARAAAIKSFQEDPKVRFFVGQTDTAGYGLTLTAAKYVIYYQNSYNLETRQQSEDRAHRAGQTNQVLYIDLVADGTVDNDIIDSLLDKSEIAAKITGDQLLEWIGRSERDSRKRKKKTAEEAPELLAGGDFAEADDEEDS